MFPVTKLPRTKLPSALSLRRRIPGRSLLFVAELPLSWAPVAVLTTMPPPLPSVRLLTSRQPLQPESTMPKLPLPVAVLPSSWALGESLDDDAVPAVAGGGHGGNAGAGGVIEGGIPLPKPTTVPLAIRRTGDAGRADAVAVPGW